MTLDPRLIELVRRASEESRRLHMQAIERWLAGLKALDTDIDDRVLAYYPTQHAADRTDFRVALLRRDDPPRPWDQLTDRPRLEFSIAYQSDTRETP